MTRPTLHTRRARWPRRLAVAAFVLALAMVGFAATVASLVSLAVPSPAAPTVTTIAPGYVPTPAGLPVPEPVASSVGGGR
jgi:hypothetical protein